MVELFPYIIFGGLAWAAYYFISGWVRAATLPGKLKELLAEGVPDADIFTETTSIRDGATLFYVGVAIDRVNQQIRLLITKNAKRKMRDQRINFSSISGLSEDSYSAAGSMHQEVVINTDVPNLPELRLQSFDSTKRLLAILRDVAGK